MSAEHERREFAALKGPRCTVLCTMLLCVLAAATVTVQQRPGPPVPASPQTASAAEEAPKGVIRGRIFGDERTAAVRAQVQLVQVESGRSVGFVSTDDDGRYEFTRVAGGDYRVSAGQESATSRWSTDSVARSSAARR